MLYNLEAIKEFDDKYNKEIHYTVGQEIQVGEERAFELLSNPNGLVKINSTKIENVEEFINTIPDEVKDKIIEDYLNSENNKTVNNTLEESNNANNQAPTTNQDDNTKELASKDFKELQELAKSKGIDITGLSTKNKLITEILKK